MNKGMSIYLEFVRVFATLLVLFSHASEFAPEEFQLAIAPLKLGRDGVILFFVLSGYVITWCAVEKEKDWKTFAISRAARIYSVAIPGLLLGAAISYYISSQQDVPLDYTLQKPWIYYPLFLTFNSQSWVGFIFPAGNFPFWSLSFEVWYYAFFGALIYTKKIKTIVVLAILIIMGPYIILFLPLWGLGSLLYFFKNKIVPTKSIAFIIFSSTLVLFILSKINQLDSFFDNYNVLLLGPLSTYLPAQQFLGDYYLAIIATINFYAAFHLNLSFGNALSKIIKTFANFSFSIYMFHTPIFLFLANTLFRQSDSYITYTVAITIALITSFFLSTWTEKKKGTLTRGINYILRIGNRR